MIDLGHVHPRQIRNALTWLKKIRADIDEEISRLERQFEYQTRIDVRERERLALMRELISKNLTDEDVEKRLVEMGWQNEDIRGCRKVLKRWAKRLRRDMRDKEILRRVLVNDEEKSALSVEYGISRVHIHRILQKSDPTSKNKGA